MVFGRGNTGFFIAFLLIGAICGSALGNFIVGFFPDVKFLTTSLTGSIGISLEIITFSIKLNLASIIGLIAGVIIFRKI